MDDKSHTVEDAISTLYTENPALGSYINRMGDRLGVGADEQAEAAEIGADTTLTTIRERALANAAGYDSNDSSERRDFILSVLDDPRFRAYAAAYDDHGKNGAGNDKREYRYSAEQAVAMERLFNAYYPENDNTEPWGVDWEDEAPVVDSPVAEPPEVVAPSATPPVAEPKPADYHAPEVVAPSATPPVAAPKREPKRSASVPTRITARYKKAALNPKSYKATYSPSRISKPHEPVQQYADRHVMTRKNIPTYHVPTPPRKLVKRGIGERIITAAKDVYKHIKHFFERISRG